MIEAEDALLTAAQTSQLIRLNAAQLVAFCAHHEFPRPVTNWSRPNDLYWSLWEVREWLNNRGKYILFFR